MRILSARQYNCNLKVTIQQTGKMNFSDDTARVLGISPEKGVKFFMEGEPEQLCMAIMEEPDDDSFQIRKSGSYYYVAALLLFDELGVDYKTYTVFFDLVRCMAYDEAAGGQSFKMNMRTIKKKSHGEVIDK